MHAKVVDTSKKVRNIAAVSMGCSHHGVGANNNREEAGLRKHIQKESVQVAVLQTDGEAVREVI